MKKYLLIVLCACIALNVGADASQRSQVQFDQPVTGHQGTTVSNSQNDKLEGVGEAYIDATQNSVEKGHAEKTIPDINGGGLVPRPRPDKPGNGGGRPTGELKPAYVLSEFGIGVLEFESTVESNAPSRLQAGSFDLITVGGGHVSVILGGGLVPRPPRNPSWGNSNVVAYVSSRDERPDMPPFIVPQEGILYTNSTGFVMQQRGKTLDPLGGGLVPRPPRHGLILPGVSVLSRGNGNASGTWRSNASSVMMGDVNDDGKVDVLDVTILNGYVLGVAPEGLNIEHADVNGDDLIDVGDVTALTHYVLNGTWPTAE